MQCPVPGCPCIAYASTLTHHANLPHDRPFKLYNCAHCMYNGPSPEHERLKHLRYGDACKCKICHLYVPVSRLSSHLDRDHEGAIRCARCEAIFYSRNAMRRHKNKEHPEHNKLHCGIGDCTYAGCNQRALKIHRDRHTRCQNCPVCNVPFENLAYHMRQRHRDL